tara:strand:- start:8673 stop:9608 length:936 start_codon:yes stop_codon:yes gene_type:complete
MKPLTTLILLAYNHEKFIESAVRSVLNQDYENIEIIISDDCSTDATFQKASDATKSYLSNKNVILNKNDKNLGLTAHFNKLLQMANGEIIVIAAGDDISLPNRVTQSVNILLEHKDVSFVSFNEELIDSNGNVSSIGKRVSFSGLHKFNLKNYMEGEEIPFSGASRAFRKDIYNYFGNLNNDCPTEDTPYILRGLMMGKTAISSDIAIQYRRHDNNLSNPLSLANMDVDAISSQYKTDIQTAESKKGISKEDALKLLVWVENNLIRRKKINQLYLSKSKITYFLRNLAFERSISTVNRVKLLGHIILKKIP